MLAAAVGAGDEASGGLAAGREAMFAGGAAGLRAGPGGGTGAAREIIPAVPASGRGIGAPPGVAPGVAPGGDCPGLAVAGAARVVAAALYGAGMAPARAANAPVGGAAGVPGADGEAEPAGVDRGFAGAGPPVVPVVPVPPIVPAAGRAVAASVIARAAWSAPRSRASVPAFANPPRRVGAVAPEGGTVGGAAGGAVGRAVGRAVNGTVGGAVGGGGGGCGYAPRGKGPDCAVGGGGGGVSAGRGMMVAVVTAPGTRRAGTDPSARGAGGGDSALVGAAGPGDPGGGAGVVAAARGERVMVSDPLGPVRTV